jgi:hypothetical protein
VKMTIEYMASVEARVLCAKCRGALVAEAYVPSAGAMRGELVITVQPCEACLEAARDEGRGEG